MFGSLEECGSTLSGRGVDYIFISTHSQQIHDNIVREISRFGYRVEVSSDLDNDTTSYDGLSSDRVRTQCKYFRILNLQVGPKSLTAAHKTCSTICDKRSTRTPRVAHAHSRGERLSGGEKRQGRKHDRFNDGAVGALFTKHGHCLLYRCRIRHAAAVCSCTAIRLWRP